MTSDESTVPERIIAVINQHSMTLATVLYYAIVMRGHFFM